MVYHSPQRKLATRGKSARRRTQQRLANPASVALRFRMMCITEPSAYCATQVRHATVAFRQQACSRLGQADWAGRLIQHYHREGCFTWIEDANFINKSSVFSYAAEAVECAVLLLFDLSSYPVDALTCCNIANICC